MKSITFARLTGRIRIVRPTPRARRVRRLEHALFRVYGAHGGVQ